MGIQARFDELDVSSVSVVGKDIGECVVSVARIVRTWAWDVLLLARVVWESVSAWRPLCCSGVTKIKERLETVHFKNVVSRLTGLSIGYIFRVC